ncbi:glutathione S-transferase family protein [Sphingobium chungbukense]|uniref:Glutathione S-transferase n=1 Tax=Sphingobium chungbukense TaxID=56193 RepID=A0A0M3ARL1_9SPHN|nr:glutathione S-transferase family protein [Sphingobium chungbukense]KKW91556.1 glutathione S-transferase [Sphingobium chungbukense]
MIELYHCDGARSFRALWMLEELHLEYRLHMLPFPPRFRAREYLEINPLGTIPFMIVDGTGMSESAAIVHYLADTNPEAGLSVAPVDPAYPDYLNFLHMGEATLTFPQTLYLRYTVLEPQHRRNPQVAGDYRRWFLKRLDGAMRMMAGRDYACGDRFSAADISMGYAIKFARALGLGDDLPPPAVDYFTRLAARPAYRRALSIEQENAVE